MFSYIRTISTQSIELKAEDRDTYTKIREELSALWKIEDLFDVFVSSLLELERCILSIGLDYAVENKIGNDRSRMQSAEVNAKLANLLFSARAFEEQSSRLLEAHFPNAKRSFCQHLNSSFEESPQYRVMYALRNAIAHGDISLINLWYGGTAEFENDDHRSEKSRSRVAVFPRARIQELLKLSKLKTYAKEELKTLSEEYRFIDLRGYWRVYVSKVAGAHTAMRVESEDVLNRGLEVCDRAANEYLSDIASRKMVILCPHKDSSLDDCRPFDLKHFTSLKERRRRWAGLEHWYRAYVSNEINMDKSSFHGGPQDLFVPN